MYICTRTSTHTHTLPQTMLYKYCMNTPIHYEVLFMIRNFPMFILFYFFTTFNEGWILSTGSKRGFLRFRFSMADCASAIAHLSIG